MNKRCLCGVLAGVAAAVTPVLGIGAPAQAQDSGSMAGPSAGTRSMATAAARQSPRRFPPLKAKPAERRANPAGSRAVVRQRVQRLFESGKVNNPWIGVVMHTIERGLQAPAQKTELDRIFEVALARHPQVSRARLRQLVDDYNAIPVAVRARAIPRALVTLDASQPLTRARLARFVGRPAPTGGTSPFTRAGGGGKIQTRPGPLGRTDGLQIPNTQRHEITPGPTITGVSLFDDDGTRRISLAGFNFETAAKKVPLAVVYLRPLKDSFDWHNADPATPHIEIGNQKVIRVIGRVVDDMRITASLPSFIVPGEYDVAVEMQKKNGAPRSPWFTVRVPSQYFRVNFLSLHCHDETNPEWGGDDEIVTTSVVSADGYTWQKNTGLYPGFADGKGQPYKGLDGAVFQPNGAGGASPGGVDKGLLVWVELQEWDTGDVEAINKSVGFIIDLYTLVAKAVLAANASGQKEGGAADILKDVKPIIQTVITFLGGAYDPLGDQALVWSVSELLERTSNQDRRFTGQLHFANNDKWGNYTLTYEVVRYDSPSR